MMVCGFAASAQETDEAAPLRLLPREVEAPLTPVADTLPEAADFGLNETVRSLKIGRASCRERV